MKINCIVIFLCLINLVSCGGSGDKSSVNNSTLTTNELAVFNLIPNYLPDLKEKYRDLCGSAVNIQNLITVDLNNDGRVDILLPVWCRFKNNQDPTGPVVNELIALIQNPDGSYSDKTFDIFGVLRPSMGGKNQNWAIADFNNDGKPDIILSVDKEDGRPVFFNATNMKVNSVALMSGQSGYTITPIGEPNWGDNVIIYKNIQNKLQLLLISASNDIEVLEYNNKWDKVSSEFVAIKNLEKQPILLSDKNDGKIDVGTYIFNRVITYDINWNQSQYLMELWKKSLNSWVKIDSSILLNIKIAKGQYRNSSNTLIEENVAVANFEGKDYKDMGFVTDGCALKVYPNLPTITIRTFLGNEIIGGYNGQIIDSSWKPPTLKIFPVEASNDKILIKPSILTAELPGNYYRMLCRDYNNDGYDDILIQLGGGGFLLYINDKSGGFKKIKDEIKPSFKYDPFAYSAVFVDVNNDGISDLIYFPITGSSNSPLVNIPIPIFNGLRNISSKDLIQ